LAGILGLLGSLTRGPGMLTSAPLAWMAWEQWRVETHPSPPERLARVVGPLLPLLGGLAFLGWRSLMGFAPMTDVLRTYSGIELVDPVRGVWYALAQWFAVHDLETTLDVSSALVFLGLTAALFINPRWRRPEWLLYTGLNLAVLLSKHSLVASSLQSTARYVLMLFPGFIVVGDWLSRRSRLVQFAYVTLSSSALIVLSLLYTFWWFIG